MLQKLLYGHQVFAGSGVPGQLGHPFAAVEFLDDCDDCLALGLCLGESDRIRKVDIRNINGSFHASILLVESFFVNEK
jgi:hypothetical protein